MQADKYPDVPARIERLLRDALNLEVPSADTDLLDGGVLDSLLLVDLLLHLEKEFRLSISLEEIEIDVFRSVRAITEFVAGQEGRQSA